jgi:hypothetical protein
VTHNLSKKAVRIVSHYLFTFFHQTASIGLNLALVFAIYQLLKICARLLMAVLKNLLAVLKNFFSLYDGKVLMFQ